MEMLDSTICNGGSEMEEVTECDPSPQDDFLTIVPRPTLLGKEKAKRRLKAFSRLKPAGRAIKKSKQGESEPEEIVVQVDEPPEPVEDVKVIEVEQDVQEEKANHVSEQEDTAESSRVAKGRPLANKDTHIVFERSGSKKEVVQRKRSRVIIKMPKRHERFNAERRSTPNRRLFGENDGQMDLLQGNSFDYRKMLLFPTLKESMKPFPYKTKAGTIQSISSQFVRFTLQSSPQVNYSSNGVNIANSYFQRKEVFSIITKPQKDCFMALVNQAAASQPIEPAKFLTARTWYPNMDFIFASDLVEDANAEIASTIVTQAERSKKVREANSRRKLSRLATSTICDLTNDDNPKDSKKEILSPPAEICESAISKAEEKEKSSATCKPTSPKAPENERPIVVDSPVQPEYLPEKPSSLVESSTNLTPSNNESDDSTAGRSPPHRSLCALIASYCKEDEVSETINDAQTAEPAALPTIYPLDCFYNDKSKQPLILKLNDFNGSTLIDNKLDETAKEEAELKKSLLAQVCQPPVGEMTIEKLKTKPSELYSPTLQSSDSSDASNPANDNFRTLWDGGNVVKDEIVAEKEELQATAIEHLPDPNINNSWESEDDSYEVVERTITKELSARSLEMPLNINIGRPRTAKAPEAVSYPHLRSSFLFEDLDGNCSWDSDLKNSVEETAVDAKQIRQMKKMLKKKKYITSDSSSSSSATSTSSSSTSSNEDPKQKAGKAGVPVPKAATPPQQATPVEIVRKPLPTIVFSKRNPLVGCSLFKDELTDEETEGAKEQNKVVENAPKASTAKSNAANLRGPFTPPLKSKRAESVSPRRGSGPTPRRRFSPSVKRYIPKIRRNKDKRESSPRRKDSPRRCKDAIEGSRSPKARRESPRARRDRSPKGKDDSPRFDRQRDRSPVFGSRHRDYDRDRYRDSHRERDRKYRNDSPRHWSSPPRRRSPLRCRYSPKRDRDRSPRYRSRSPRRRTRSKSPPRRVYAKRSNSVDRKQESIKQTLHRLAGVDYDTASSSPSFPIDRFNSHSGGRERHISEELLQHRAAYNTSTSSPSFYFQGFNVEGSPKRIPLDDRISQVLGLEDEKSNEVVYTAHAQEGSSTYYQEGYYDVGYGKDYAQLRNYADDSVTDDGASSTKVLQVGNVLQVVPSDQVIGLKKQPQEDEVPDVAQKFVPVGNMVQIVPTTLTPELAAVPERKVEASTTGSGQQAQVEAKKKIQKQLEKDSRRAERELRRKDKEAKRKIRVKRRLMKLKAKSEAIIKKAMLLDKVNDEAEDDSDAKLPSVSIVALPGTKVSRGILRKKKELADGETAPALKKRVRFADGVIPGEGTSPSGGEDLSSPPPFQKLRKEKRLTKTKKEASKHSKKKIKVKVVKKSKKNKQSDDEEDDQEPPPPPPPGSPPPHIFPPRVKFIYPTNFYTPPYFNAANCRPVADMQPVTYPNFHPMQFANATVPPPHIFRPTFPPPPLGTPPNIANILPLPMHTIPSN